MIEGVTSDLGTTLNSLNSIMVTNAEHINAVVTNLDALTANLNKMVDPVSGDVTRMVGGLADVSETLSNNTSQMDSIFMNINNITTQLDRARIADLKASLDSLSEITAKLNADGGT